jgi:hypothetical protein
MTSAAHVGPLLRALPMLFVTIVIQIGPDRGDLSFSAAASLTNSEAAA